MLSLQFEFEIIVKATLILACAAGAARLLKDASAASRQLVWTVAFVALLLLPLLSLSMPKWRWAPPVTRPPAIQPAPAANVAVAVPPAIPAREFPWASTLMCIYLAGFALAISRLFAGVLRMRGVTKQAQRAHAPEWMEAQVEILESEAIALPVTWGLFRPVILLPAAAREWPLDRLRLVFAHELAHIERWDFPGQIAAHLACALYWFHPLAWWAMKQLVKEREQACDDEVLNMGVAGTDYAGHLVEIIRSAASNRQSYSPAVGMAQPSTLEKRLTAMLDTGVNRRPPARRTAAWSVFAAACLLLPLAGLHAPAQTNGASVAGVVRDPSGAVVPHAMILLANSEGSNTEAAYTGQVGGYQFRGVPPGRYTLEVRSAGFEVYAQKDLTLTSGASVAQDVTLHMGRINENVEVAGKRPQPVIAQPYTGTRQRILVGGNVQASKLLTRVEPVYPERALQQGIQGTVILRAVIGTDGRLLSLGSASASVDPDLTGAALDAVRLWTYEPTLLNGVPVEVTTNIAVTFRLTQ